MPFLALVHLRELRCAQCNELLAQAGARSFLVDESGEALNFSENEPPAEMTVAIYCSNGHENPLYVPNEIAAEETLYTPEEAPIARDAIMLA
jgi:phage FluMu protein Com